MEPNETKQPEGSELAEFYDIPLNVIVQLGESGITIRDLLALQKGSVIELEKLAGEPLEIYVNDILVSKGEVVVINEKYGIRLTDVVQPIK